MRQVSTCCWLKPACLPIRASVSLVLAGLAAEGLRQERRSLVLRPENLTAAWLSDHDLELGFSLSSGSYATVIVREICAV